MSKSTPSLEQITAALEHLNQQQYALANQQHQIASGVNQQQETMTAMSAKLGATTTAVNRVFAPKSERPPTEPMRAPPSAPAGLGVKLELPTATGGHVKIEPGAVPPTTQITMSQGDLEQFLKEQKQMWEKAQGSTAAISAAAQDQIHQEALIAAQRKASSECRDNLMTRLMGDPDGGSGAAASTGGGGYAAQLTASGSGDHETVTIPKDVLTALMSEKSKKKDFGPAVGKHAVWAPKPTRHGNKYYVAHKHTGLPGRVFCGWACFQSHFEKGQTWDTMRGNFFCTGDMAKAAVYFFQEYGQDGKWTGIFEK